jgi:hypothetical protein
MASSNETTSQGQCNLFMEGGYMKVQQEPRVTRVKISDRNHTKMFGHPDERDNCGRPRQGQEERIAGMRLTQACRVSLSAKIRKMGTTESKSSSCPPVKGQVSPESPLRKRIQNFLQYLNSIAKSKGQENSLPKVEMPSATTHSQGSVTSRHMKVTVAAKAHGLTKVVAQIAEDKLGLQHRSVPSEMCWHKEEAQALLGRHYCPRGSSDQKPNRVMRNTCVCQQDSHKGHSHPTKNRWTRGGCKSGHAAQGSCVPSQSRPT